MFELRPTVLTEVNNLCYIPRMNLRRYAAPSLALSAACLLAGCSSPAPQPAAAAPPYHLVASIREVMNSVIDPNIDVVWNSVSTTIDHGKPTDHAPANDEDWAAVRHSALTVIEGANLLMMPGRQVAPAGA